MIIGRRWILLLLDECVEIGLLRGRRLKNKQHLLERKIIAYDAFIELWTSERMYVAFEGHELRFVDSPNLPGWRTLRKGARNRCREQERSGEAQTFSNQGRVISLSRPRNRKRRFLRSRELQIM